MESENDTYDTWTKEDLIERIRELEGSIVTASASTLPLPPQSQSSHLHAPHQHRLSPKKTSPPFDFSKHPTRKIALKFCYNGSEYSGLEFQKLPTALPTVEGVLFDALAHVKFVDKRKGLEGCGWEKCGRTDRGVSGAGNVVSFWIRSAIGDKSSAAIGDGSENVREVEEAVTVKQKEQETETKTRSEDVVRCEEETKRSVSTSETSTPAEASSSSSSLSLAEDDFGGLMMNDWDEEPSNTSTSLLPSLPSTSSPVQQRELKYIFHLNNILPPSIRVLAWSPVKEDFSARFNCKWRHYKYFFLSDGLDIEKMKEGAERLVGEHDFRNLCKLDVSKQLTSFRRKILRATISPVEHDGNLDFGKGNLWVFDLVGTAFLYNQVRHIMAILFLIGTNLEEPTLVTALLNTDPNNPYPPFREGDPIPEVVTSKPEYQMADPLPLVLWDTGFDEGDGGDVRWRTDDEPGEEGIETNDIGDTGKSKGGMSQRDLSGNLYSNLHSIFSRSLIHTTLDYHFLLAATRNGLHKPPPNYLPVGAPGTTPLPSSQQGGKNSNPVLSIPVGGGIYRRGARYIKVLERKRLDDVEVANERWRLGKGKRRLEKLAAQKADDMDE
ncbi:pseudouridine synthase [Abortiporus biennis]|nr:pseudouridine synthase [Abortiporus biennis]